MKPGHRCFLWVTDSKSKVPPSGVWGVGEVSEEPTIGTGLDRAIEYYKQLGATDWAKRGKPYDVSLTLAGAIRHVEVKGSSLLIETVELTANEVTHATDYQPTDLVVVDGIEWTRVDRSDHHDRRAAPRVVRLDASRRRPVSPQVRLPLADVGLRGA